MVSTNGFEPESKGTATARSAAQREASKRNGAKSRGPRTADGKQRSAMNAVKHGAFAVAPVLPTIESADDWATHRQDVIDSLAPSNHLETVLTERIASILWRLNRIDHYEQRRLAVKIEAAPVDVRERFRYVLQKPVVDNVPDAEDDLECRQSAQQSLLRLDSDVPDSEPIDGETAATVVGEIASAAKITSKRAAEIADVYDVLFPEHFEGWTWGTVREFVADVAAECNLDVAELVANVQWKAGMKLFTAEFTLNKLRGMADEIVTENMMLHGIYAKWLISARDALERSLHRAMAELRSLKG